MRTALHVYPSHFTHESRMLKETKTLADADLFDQIHIGAIWARGLIEHERLDGKRRVWRVRLATRRLPGIPGKVIRSFEWYLRLLLHFGLERPTFINCHSLSVLPLGVVFRALFGTRVVYDTHELETETQSSRGVRRKVMRTVERLLIRYADGVVVVSDSIASWYRDEYSLRNVYVVRNVPYSATWSSSGTSPMKRELGIDSNAILFVYQGLMAHGRAIEVILEAFSRVGADRHILFLGDGPLTALVMAAAMRHSNIHYHPAVAPEILLEITAQADIGLSLIEPTCLSYYYSLPNKLFEYLAGGLPVVVSDFPEMARLIDETGCGWKAPVEAKSLADLAGSLTHEEIETRSEAAKSAARSLCWEKEEVVLLKMYADLLNRQPCLGQTDAI